ncbi:emp24/gp25L/p24 family/GOLD-domain-containing protein [Cantharellus anzutake]|uniref:emp24/gp25L/p24 family/GOLD-domain-containing protein n=1 Tax=Cantharellus anzutake TaxID=1750568 RepID=UPI00190523A7|nr:emp24/gp25L/p24 family/GOLD-domain-containing protein [Cantharellus anzutake]KAF8342867.1 emp24/gp25L/p24 family/GOLD-domain-containing protein [Cantharellus anzutake]
MTLFALLAIISCILSVHAIKFELPSSIEPEEKCIWNAAHSGALIIVTANVGPGKDQRVDVEIREREGGNVYLNKKNIRGETRLAVTAHRDDDVGVCFRNTLEPTAARSKVLYIRIIDLDVDIGADAVDYNAIANQDGLSALEVEMRKLEGIVKEIVEELGYLKERESRFSSTNDSTNLRVQNFYLFTIFALLCLGVWQILHLRAFFRRKYLID